MRPPTKAKRLRKFSGEIQAEPTQNQKEPIDKKLKNQETRSQSVASTKMAQAPMVLAAVINKIGKSSNFDFLSDILKADIFKQR